MRATLCGLVMVLATSLVLAGCGGFGLCSFVPCRPLESPYVVDRNGRYYAGDRCSLHLVEIGVFRTDESLSRADPSYFDHAAWYARAVSGVAEFELYFADQAGVVVVSDDGSRLYDQEVFIEMRDAAGHWFGMRVTLGQGSDGMVANGGPGWVPSQEYWAKPTSDFGCAEPR